MFRVGAENTLLKLAIGAGAGPRAKGKMVPIADEDDSCAMRRQDEALPARTCGA